MSMSGVWKTAKSGASNLKVNLVLTCTGESDHSSSELLIEDLGKIRFKWDAKICNNKNVPVITHNFSLSKCDMNDDRIIKTNIVCEELNYSRTDIHTPNTWTEWILMGSKKTVATVGSQVFCTQVHLLITMYEVKTNKISPISYSDTEFTDFNLSTEEGSVPVHKACLAGHSDVFKAMLRGEWKETSEGQIKIKGVTLKTLQQLKNYMYLGTMPDKYDISGLRPLLLIARCYLIEDLEKQCIRKLAEEITPEELFSLIDFACENQIPELPFTLLQLTKDSVIEKAHRIKKKICLKKETKNTTND